MTSVKKIAPHPLLAGDIDFYWYMQRYDATAAEARLFPTASPEIIFNLSGSDIYLDDGNAAPDFELVGALAEPVSVNTAQQFTLLGVRFFPHTLKYAFREQMHLLTGNITAAGLVLDKPAQALKQELVSLSSIQLQVNCLNNFFIQRLYRRPLQRDKWFSFFTALQKTTKPLTVDRIVQNLGYSTRYTEKLFRSQLGISPQQFVQIRRLHKALGLISNTTASMTHIAYDCGFADQSHFIRSFKSLTGQTPLQYRKEKAGINVF